jgi:uncharacterized protein with PIN domain
METTPHVGLIVWTVVVALIVIVLVSTIWLSKKTREVKIGLTDEDKKPLCPHCGEELSTLISHRSHLRAFYNLHVFVCPHCRKVLGVSTTFK